MTTPSIQYRRWNEVPLEKVTDRISRKLITGQGMMLAQVFLAKGAIVPKHQHHNEQFTYIISGGLRFYMNDDGAEVIDVMAGEVLHIPSNVWHKAEALEDTLDVDIFNPPREDWLNHTDSYFQKK